MIHLGDITNINGADAPPVNVIIGGSPCQDLSIAGRRAGLAGERSGLFMEQLRIIKEMRKADEERGRTGKEIRPRYMVWENVPGAFSSNKGDDFGAVLQETVKVVCEKVPDIPKPKNGWPTAGCLTDLGGKWSIAWRVLDAQFWGVPQRRRRIALIADFGGLTAPEILFERESVSGYYPQGRTPWERTAAHTQRDVGTTGKYVCVTNRGCDYGEITETLRSESHGAIPMTYCIQGNCIDRDDTAGCNGKGWTEDVSYTLNTVDRPATAYPVMAIENHPADSRVKLSEDNVIQTLSCRMGTGGGNTPLILDGGGSVSIGSEIIYTSTCGSFMQSNENIVSTLTARDYKQPQIVCYKNEEVQDD